MDKRTVLNNFNDGMKITSYDEKKVWIKDDGQNHLFCKYTTSTEVETNSMLSQSVLGQTISVSGVEHKIYLPRIYDWDDEKRILTMEYCKGKNLEFILRNKDTYNYGVTVLNKLLTLFIELGIYWIDFAPRNVLIEENKVCIVDFEKGIGYYNGIKQYLRNHVYEEYGSFSFIEDRMFTPDEVFELGQDEENKDVYIPSIGPKRIKAMAKLLGYDKHLSQREFLQIIKTFIIAEQPTINNGIFIFPRVYLEQILKDKNTNPSAFDNYALEVLKINIEKGNQFVKEYKR